MSDPLYEEHSMLLKSCGWEESTVDLESVTSDDLLLLIDCQNDFFPMGTVEDGGRFGVADGERIVPYILKLIDRFTEKHCVIVASKDYHPTNHCSFTTNGGQFPPHCVQGTKGGEFHSQIGSKLWEKMKEGNQIVIGYKGSDPALESFSALPYVDESGKERFGDSFVVDPANVCSVSKEVYTHIDQSPNDLSSQYTVLSEIQEKMCNPHSRTFVCGLAFDFCVIDSGINAQEWGSPSVYIIHEATRASHIPGIGSYGSGFLTNPQELMDKIHKHSIHLVNGF